MLARQCQNPLFTSNAQHRSFPEEAGHQTMNEDNFARRVVGRLDQGLADLPPEIAEELAHARRRALGLRAPAPSLTRLRVWFADHRLTFGVALPALLVLVAAGILVYLQAAFTPDLLDIETALLADELPIHAYTDPGFVAWLSRTSHAP